MKTGVIDIHTHGLGGHETRGATPRDILMIAEAHGACGVDAILPTIYPSSMEQMRSDMAAVGKAMELQDHGGRTPDLRGIPSGSCRDNPGPAAILGVNLEGPFLNPLRAGALRKAAFVPPRIALFEELIEGFAGIVKIITVAPELDGALGLIRAISDAGIVVSMGHSDATFNEAEAGYNAGARGITHLFNAMRGIHHREPGIAGFGLTNPHVFVEVIADPFHLHPKIIELIFAARDHKSIIIVSDSVKASKTGGAPGGISGRSGRLQGGAMSIMESIRRLGDLGIPEETLEGCISTNPAKYLAR